MSDCYLLCDISNTHRAITRAETIGGLLGQLGFRCITLDKSRIPPTLVSSLETQSGMKDAWYAAYAYTVASLITPGPGDLIIATEAWHADCFRGLLSLEGGSYKGAPVIEMWVDYPGSFAKYRVFSSRFSMYATAALLNRGFTSEWIVGTPALKSTTKILNSVHPAVCVDEAYPHSLDFLEHTLKGIPVVAPDWGAWQEFIKHGVTGVLYRSQEGKAKAIEKAQALSSKRIVETTEGWFTMDRAAEGVAKYLNRLSNG